MATDRQVISERPDILVTGGQGRLARALRRYLPNADYRDHRTLDIRTLSDRAVIERFGLVIHAAAVTTHSGAGRDYMQTNVYGTANLVRLLRPQQRIVYTSTDYVYPGNQAESTEEDAVLPWNAYAWSKLGGECAVRLHPDHLIIRGSWYESLPWDKAPTDAWTSKMRADEAARMIALLALTDAQGVVNIGGPRRTYYEVALGEDMVMTPCKRGDLKAPVPQDVSLDTARSRAILSREALPPI